VEFERPLIDSGELFILWMDEADSADVYLCGVRKRKDIVLYTRYYGSFINYIMAKLMIIR
jgi:hypothetical protein